MTDPIVVDERARYSYSDPIAAPVVARRRLEAEPVFVEEPLDYIRTEPITYAAPYGGATTTTRTYFEPPAEYVSVRPPVYLPPTSPPTVIVDDSKTVRKLELRIAQLESELKLKDDDLRTRGVWQIKCTALEKANRSLEMESTSLQQKCYRLESQNKELDAELQNLIRHSKTKLNHLAYARQDLVEERDLLAVEVCC